MIPAAPFPENEYGVIKRLQVIGAWMNRIQEQTGKPFLTVLDYGCGTGDQITYPLALAGHDVVGLDLHEPSILEARRRYALPNLSFRPGTLDVLLREGTQFDAIVCSEVLEHLSNPGEFLGNLRPLLRHDGGLIVTTPNGYGSFEMLCRLERGLNRTGVHQLFRWIFRRGTGSADDANPGFLNRDSRHVQFFRLKKLGKMFRDSGFHIVDCRARTILCGPYVDLAFRLCPFRQAAFHLNNRLADLLPFSWAADWMFLLNLQDPPL